GPPTNTPFSGTNGYTKVDGVYIILDSAADLTDPSLLADSPNGPFAIWMTRAGVDIWRSDLAHLGTDATPLRPALAPADSWEGTSVVAPSVERDATGYHMAYEAAGGIIAVADSSDGEHWTGRRMIGPGHAPSLARGFVFYESNGEIWRAPRGVEAAVHLLTGTNPDIHVRQTSGGREI